MERAVERGLKLRPFRIYQGDLPGDYLDERANTLLLACLRGMSLESGHEEATTYPEPRLGKLRATLGDL